MSGWIEFVPPVPRRRNLNANEPLSLVISFKNKVSRRPESLNAGTLLLSGRAPSAETSLPPAALQCAATSTGAFCSN